MKNARNVRQPVWPVWPWSHDLNSSPVREGGAPMA